MTWTDLHRHRSPASSPDLADLPAGFERERDALETSAACGFNLLMVGPPGIGATMVARRLPSILPRLNASQQRWIDIEYRSAWIGPAPSAEVDPDREPPFRAPHHSISTAAMVGAEYRPGELHLARFGVLYLDELHEFRKPTIEATGAAIARMGLTAPLVVASAHPCPCGYRGTPARIRPSWACNCSEDAIQRHQLRLASLSVPLRFRVQIESQQLGLSRLRDGLRGGESSAEVRQRIVAARNFLPLEW